VSWRDLEEVPFHRRWAHTDAVEQGGGQDVESGPSP